MRKVNIYLSIIFVAGLCVLVNISAADGAEIFKQIRGRQHAKPDSDKGIRRSSGNKKSSENRGRRNSQPEYVLPNTNPFPEGAAEDIQRGAEVQNIMDSAKDSVRQAEESVRWWEGDGKSENNRGIADLYLMGNHMFRMHARYVNVAGFAFGNIIELKGNGLSRMYFIRSRKILYFTEGNIGTFAHVQIVP